MSSQYGNKGIAEVLSKNLFIDTTVAKKALQQFLKRFGENGPHKIDYVR